ncbi:MAG: cadherin-like beta sandwich domain-containing protein [Nitrospira sp.]
MIRTMTVAGQYLAAVLFVAIALGTYGCGDTASVNPEVELSRLTVSPGTLQPGFSGGITSYRVDLTSNIASVIVTAQAAVSGDTVTINGQATTSRTITLDPAGSTTIVSIVVSESDTNSRTYTVRLVRAGLAGNNSLQGLTVSSGTLAPAFDANVQSYTVNVANSVGSVNVTPTLSDPAATVTVNGQAAISGQARAITLNGPGQSTNITIIVTAQNGNDKTYLATVSRGVSNNNNLQTLPISPGPLAPSFSAGTVGYTVNVGSGVASVTVTPTLQDTAASMTVNGQATNSGQARTITLNAPGANTFINIVVNPQSGPSKTYSVNVIRAALAGNNNLSALSVSPGPLAPAFSTATEDYTVNVGSGVTSVTVTPTEQDTAASTTVNGQVTNSGQARTITLNGAGSNTLINIAVTAQNGSQKTYSVNVIRAALGGNNNLSGLSVTPGPLSPAFTTNTEDYTVNVESGVTSVTVTPTEQDTAASTTVNGQVTNSGQARTITLNGAGSNTLINIAVTAQNGSQRTYSVNVIRAALGGNNNLSALTVSPGTLSPAFTSARTAYTVNNVSSSDTSILVTATPQDSSATVTINTQGGNSRSIPLPGGPSSTEIEVSVTAPNGNDKTYLITVNQPAPAAPPAPPASAPDLISADDSCPLGVPPNVDADGCAPGTSRSDNNTNITTPRFAIPQPGPGLTPNLYMGPTKIPSTFNATNSTLQPTAPLPDGTHTITSTVTSTATNLESDKSGGLQVTIDSTAPGDPG